jgi:hypothetical protein
MQRRKSSASGQTNTPEIKLTHYRGLTQEQKANYVPPSFFSEAVMFRALMEEAAALASISLFLATIAIWAQLFSNF